MNIISDKAVFYESINIQGDNVRIDDFCIFTGNIQIGSNIHIGCYGFMSGKYGIVLEDFVQVAPRVSMFTACDDFSGCSLVGPTIPDEFKPKLKTGRIILKKHALIGAHSIIMPGVTIGEGASVGALSLVNRSLEPWGVYAGIPAIRLMDRSKKMLELEKEFRDKNGYNPKD